MCSSRYYRGYPGISFNWRERTIKWPHGFIRYFLL